MTSATTEPRRDTEPGSTRDPRRRSNLRFIALGVGLIAAGLGALLVAEAFDVTPEPRLVGGNLPVNEGATEAADVSAHNSPRLAQNPADENNLVVANRIDTPGYSCALHVSFDGGATFRQLPIPVPAGEEPKCYAPDVAFSSDGILHMIFVTLAGQGNVPNAVWHVRSDDGGRSLGAPERVVGQLAFQVGLEADPVVPERLYLTWLQADEVGLYRFTNPGNPIMVMVSDDGGTTWSGPTEVSDPARQRVVTPVAGVGPDGRLRVLYVDVGDDRLDYEGAHEGRGGPPHPGSFTLVLATSPDGGETWSEAEVGTMAPPERFIVFNPPSPSLAIDQSDGSVYVAFHDRADGGAGVSMWTSRNGGDSFGPPVRIDDTDEDDETSQYLPHMGISLAGRIDVVYYDRRDDPENVMNEVSLQSSFDGGETFSRRVTLTDRPFDSRIGFGSQRDMADLGTTLALLSTDDKAMAAWTDTRAGTEESNKQDIVRQFVAFSEEPSASPAVRHLLPQGGWLAVLAGASLVLVPAARRARRGQ
jgi:hypothetical protein